MPLYLAVNKCESERLGHIQAADFWEAGLGNPYPVSGIHGTGLGDLMDEIIQGGKLKKVVNVLKDNSTNIALLGRPNVGKSSLFNTLLGKDRAMVSDVAGTTRDTIDCQLTAHGNSYRYTCTRTHTRTHTRTRAHITHIYSHPCNYAHSAPTHFPQAGGHCGSAQASQDRIRG